MKSLMSSVLTGWAFCFPEGFFLFPLSKGFNVFLFFSLFNQSNKRSPLLAKHYEWAGVHQSCVSKSPSSFMKKQYPGEGMSLALDHKAAKGRVGAGPQAQ